MKLLDDPWSLTRDERRALRDSLAMEQRIWLARIRDLVEPPAIDAGFPAFLLAVGPFASLRAGLCDAPAHDNIDTATADELQRFVDRYRDYLV